MTNCKNRVDVIFQGITFSDPTFPWGDVNGTYQARKVAQPPPGYCQYNFHDGPDQNGVFLQISVTTGIGYYHITLALYRTVDGWTTEELVFNAQGPSIPLDNVEVPANGGTATVQ